MDELMRDRFMELVYDLLRDDDSNQRANAIINCADEYAESMKQQWIPVEERLPEDDTEVLVYLFENNKSPYIAWLSDGRWYTEYFEVEREDEPVAWMPLPEPYQGESEDKE